jgi:hypothetical protein
MSRSVYGRRSGALKTIYGGGLSVNCPKICDCVADPEPIQAILQLDAVLTLLKTAVQNFYPSDTVRAPFTAPLSTRAGIPATHLLRMAWVRDHPGVQFDKTNSLHRFQLKDLYLMNGLDWTRDPLFKT